MDLFGPAVPGLGVHPDLIDSHEEAALIDWAATVPVEPFRFQGWTGKRLTHSFGWRYDFDDHSFGPVAPIPEILLPLRARAAAFAGLAAEKLVQAMVTRYDPGAGIGWHRDRPVFEHVVGLSLGAPATMRFRRRTATGFARASLPLAPRAAYYLSGEARHDWEHSIAEMTATRWSITLRSLSERGKRTRA